MIENGFSKNEKGIWEKKKKLNKYNRHNSQPWKNDFTDKSPLMTRLASAEVVRRSGHMDPPTPTSVVLKGNLGKGKTLKLPVLTCF